MIKIFISHSSHDSLLAELFVNLLREATNLPPKNIRCTSVEGYKLKGGSNINEVLKDEVLNAEIFIALLSKASLQSTYVIFELGARWSTNKRLIPILAPNISPEELTPPLSALHSHCCNSSEIHQLLSEISQELDLTLNSPALYQKNIEKITNYQPLNASDTERGSIVTNIQNANLSNNNEKTIKESIKQKARSDYPNDFSMQKHIIEEEISAWNELNNFNPEHIPKNILNTILKTAQEEYNNDFSMQLHEIKEQIESWVSINKQ